MGEIIGRKKEIELLINNYKSNQSEFIVVYGRRRIGKTYLINNVFDEQFSFSYIGGHHLTSEQQLAKFGDALKKYSRSAFAPRLKDWFEAFRHLQAYIESLPDKQRKLIFFDEMPWIDTQHSDFVTALEDFWNSWAALRRDICFIACGSASSWMVDKLVENQGGLHNRITSRIYLSPFNLSECETYLRSRGITWDRYQITQCYMVFGGVPYYLKQLDPRLSLAQNIDDLVFNPNGLLSNEFDELYNALFKNADKYIAVVEALSKKREGMTRQEIIEATGISGGGLTKTLNNLERCDFIIGYSKFNSTSKNTLFRLVDFYTLFFFRFGDGIRSKDKEYWTHHLNHPQVMAWQGLTFELVCLLHLDQIKRTLGISGIATYACSWRSNDKENRSQIDLLIDRDDRIINICEMKFSVGPFIINKDYEMKLRQRLSIFGAETKTRKGLSITFVTTFGIVQNLHSGIVQNQVVMDNLFDN